MSKSWNWKVMITNIDGVKYTQKFQTANLHDLWLSSNNEERSRMVRKVMWTSPAKQKAFIWYFENEDSKQRFIDEFRASLQKVIH